MNRCELCNSIMDFEGTFCTQACEDEHHATHCEDEHHTTDDDIWTDEDEINSIVNDINHQD